MLIGMGTPIQTLPISDAALREVDLIGVFRYAGEYKQAITLLSESGADHPDFTKLVTHRFQGFDRIEDAFKTASSPKDAEEGIVLKVAIDFA
jgi:L-iditol 2-dehydrogenase